MEEHYRKCFGKNLKKFRQIAGMTQDILSEKLGITSQHLSYLETGSRSPSFEVMVYAADAFNLSLSDLFVDSGKDSIGSKHKETMLKISQLTKNLSKEDQERILKIVMNCIKLNTDRK